MGQQKKYVPIDCNFYDRIEAAIVLRKVVQLAYWDESGHNVLVETRLKDTLVTAGEEFLILPTGDSIRMDRIISLDGEAIPKSC
ncbi:MAG: hypothetical protein DHS20C18_42090 [Saprospiraceae bacterium]|nr:MAG: hypothetical protein DHS20C18_42090 [Saprospiraceae bacterium]